MGKLTYNAKRKIKTGVAIGACAIAATSIGGFATKKFVEANDKTPTFDLNDLPLVENDVGNKLYSKNQYCNIVLTNQFENEFFKYSTEEQILAMIGFKEAVNSFNALTNYYHYSLFAETNAFEQYGIKKNTSKENIIPVTLRDDPTLNEYAETTLYPSNNGEIQKCEMRFNEMAMFGVFEVYEDASLMFAKENSAIYSIAQHELGHTIGIKDFYYEDIHDEKSNKTIDNIMYYTPTSQTRTYTDYDRAIANDLVSRIISKQQSKDEEIER